VVLWLLHTITEETNILRTISGRNTNWIGLVWHRNCLIKYVIERKIQGRVKVMGRCGRRCKQILDDLKEKTEYWTLKEEALDHNMRRTCCGRGYGPVFRQTVK
jgi:hypothetical protein